ncbi:hypothetical protein RIF29_19842 [Crotalaria pallida]|uniref:Uncharacterized protein n=1 Tax=Crotalaria pallida TaxID=3830 RepID=A0AAN9F0L0_CROPI
MEMSKQHNSRKGGSSKAPLRTSVPNAPRPTAPTRRALTQERHTRVQSPIPPKPIPAKPVATAPTKIPTPTLPKVVHTVVNEENSSDEQPLSKRMRVADGKAKVSDLLPPHLATNDSAAGTTTDVPPVPSYSVCSFEPVPEELRERIEGTWDWDMTIFSSYRSGALVDALVLGI